MTSNEPVLVKYLQDDRKVEVIGRWVCIEGVRETTEVVVLEEHPNRQAILKAVPMATHMAGRIPLRMAEASVAQAALRRANDKFDGSAHAVSERMRHAIWQKLFAEGAE
jgi:hypothetical protein